ncbi:hypothetical protein DM01DRAFT_243191, partial [Hesseltinella vesiculosa]
FIGNKGLGMGSRIKGHSRVGGLWHRRACRQDAITLIANEDRTSMTCPFCRSRIVHPKKSNGRTNNGTSMCLNKSC